MLMVGTILKNGLYAGLFTSFGSLILTSLFLNGLVIIFSLLKISIDKRWKIHKLYRWTCFMGIFYMYDCIIFSDD